MLYDTSVVKELLDFLRSHKVAVLATLKAGNIPHAATIYYYVDNDFNFYFLTKNETAKFTNLKNNLHVGLVVSDEQKLQTVQIEGVAKEVDYTKEYAGIMNEYNQQFRSSGPHWDEFPINHMPHGYYSFVQIKPTWIRWSDFKDWAHTIKYEQHFS